MTKKFLASLLLLTFCLIAPVSAKTIIWVAENLSGDSDTDVANDWQPWIDKLTAAGYTLNAKADGYWNALTDAKQAELNAADLVIVSRAINSSTFSTDAAEINRWNSVTAPMICSSPYVIRKASGTAARWNWINYSDSSLPQNNGDQGCPKLQAVVPSHPIFYGVALDSSNQVQIADPTVGSGNCSFAGVNTVGNGTLLAKTVPTTLVQDWAWIAEWQKGVEFYAGSGSKAGGHRIYFTAGARETPTGGTFKEAHYNLTDEGWKLFLNAVKYMIGDSINPTTASSPSPANGASDVLVSTAMSWTAGASVQTHDVYLGTSFADVTNASRSTPLGVLVKQANTASTFTPAAKLAYGTTYYWRVDEVEQSGAIDPGIVWSFTTEPYAYVLATTITATASTSASGASPQYTCDGSGITVRPDGNDVAGIVTSPQTMWLSAKNPIAPTWISYQFDRVYRLGSMWVWNYNDQSEADLAYGIQTATVTYSTDGTSWATFGDVTLQDGPGDPNYTCNNKIDLKGIAAQYVTITAKSNFGGKAYGLAEVRFFWVPTFALYPVPASGAASLDPTATTLSWRAGRETVSNSVYMGTDPNVLTQTGTSAAPSFTPNNLVLGNTYYWRVDEVNDNASPTIWTGNSWYFTTVNLLVIDDFEKYGKDLGVNTIFDGYWSDGYVSTGTASSSNGALVGYDTAQVDTAATPPINHPNFLEGATVNPGGSKQSLPFRYGVNKSAPISEITLDLTKRLPKYTDWTAGGVTTLMLWFYGDPANSAAPLYVKINDAKVAYYRSNSDLQQARWTPWPIALSGVATNLKSVTKLTIGISGAGNSGTLLIDDIRLYKTAPAGLPAAVNPGTNGLVSYFNMESSKVADSISGVTGAPTDVAFAASKDTSFGMAAKFNGTSTYVDFGLDYWTKVLSKLSSSTFSVWVNFAGSNNWARVVALGTGENANVLLIPNGANTGSGPVRFQVKTNVPNDGTPATGYVTTYIESSSPLSVGWHHLVGVVDAAAAGFTYPVLYLYVDGVRVAGPVAGKLPKDIDVVSGTAPQMWLGRSHHSADPYFNGSADEFKVFNRALSAGEIAYLAGDR